MCTGVKSWKNIGNVQNVFYSEGKKYIVNVQNLLFPKKYIVNVQKYIVNVQNLIFPKKYIVNIQQYIVNVQNSPRNEILQKIVLIKVLIIINSVKKHPIINSKFSST